MVPWGHTSLLPPNGISIGSVVFAHNLSMSWLSSGWFVHEMSSNQYGNCPVTTNITVTKAAEDDELTCCRTFVYPQTKRRTSRRSWRQWYQSGARRTCRSVSSSLVASCCWKALRRVRSSRILRTASWCSAHCSATGLPAVLCLH